VAAMLGLVMWVALAWFATTATAHRMMAGAIALGRSDGFSILGIFLAVGLTYGLYVAGKGVES
jgi:hypothetical protein